MKYDFFYDFCIGNYSEKRRFPCYIIKNNEVQVTLIEDEDRAVYDRIDLRGQILNNSIDYIITSVIIQCDVKHLLLPFRVESVTIDRPNGKKYCNADNCRIELQSGINLFLLGTSAGSLFSKDMKTLYHLHRDRQTVQHIELDEHLLNLSPGSICFEHVLRKLTIPAGVKELKTNTISGKFNEIDFKGGLRFIENGALDKVIPNGECTLKINSPLSEINDEGKEELKKWYNVNPQNRKVIFAAPNQQNGHILENGFIELSEVISMDEKVNSGKDTRPVIINADINEGLVIQDSQIKDITNVPIIIKEIFLENATYTNIPITQISFATNNEIKIFVYERFDEVSRLIQKSYKGK